MFFPGEDVKIEVTISDSQGNTPSGVRVFLTSIKDERSNEYLSEPVELELTSQGTFACFFTVPENIKAKRLVGIIEAIGIKKSVKRFSFVVIGAS